MSHHLRAVALIDQEHALKASRQHMTAAPRTPDHDKVGVYPPPPPSVLRGRTGNLRAEWRCQAVGRRYPRRLLRLGAVALPGHVRRDRGGGRLQHLRGHAGVDWDSVFPGNSSVGVGHGGAAGVFWFSRRRRRELEVWRGFCCISCAAQC